MPLNLNEFMNEDFEEITFGDDKLLVPAYLPAEMAVFVSQLQGYADMASLTTDKIDAKAAKRVQELYKLEKRIIVGILTTKREGKHVNDPRKVKKFVKHLSDFSFQKVFSFVFAYFRACEDKKKISSVD